jgi:dTDP-4-dehydrorhamnose 3,5-epimerase
MIFSETELRGVFIIDIEKREDERGFFARTWCADEFSRLGLDTALAQTSVSFNKLRGTLRGMHWQEEPFGEVKVVRCTAGAVYDVVVDLRPDSPTFHRWIGVELSACNRRMLYIPKNFAHGFQTLEDNTEMFYQMSTRYTAEAARGARYNDPAFGITWPLAVAMISDKDRSWPDFL